MNPEYLFTSARLGFRNWKATDLPHLAALNQDPEVMEHFPELISWEESEAYIKRMQLQFETRGYCYFAVDVLENQSFIGFIGMSYQDFDAFFTPCVDIGWRLSRKAWGKGYATEGALRCLHFAFEDLGLQTILAHCTTTNTKSRKVMEKIGMEFKGTFKHPKLKDYPVLENCYLYEKRHDS